MRQTHEKGKEMTDEPNVNDAKPEFVTPGVLADVAMVTEWHTEGASTEQRIRESRIGRAVMCLLMAHLHHDEQQRRVSIFRALQIVAALSAEGEA